MKQTLPEKVSHWNSNNVYKPVNLLIKRAETQPHQVAYTFLKDGETEEFNLTYQKLDQRAREIAAYIQLFCKPGDRALLLYPSGLEFIEAFFGCLYAKVVAVPAYPPRQNQNMSRLQKILKDAQATVILTTKSLLSNIEIRLAENLKLTELHYIATDILPIEKLSSWQEPELNSDTLAFLQYTSGSTGTPKGVIVSHGNIIYNQQMIELAFQHDETAIGMGWLPLFHDLGLIGNVLQPLYVGFPCILMSPTAFLQKPVRWLQAISRYRATTSGGPNFAYDLCTNRISPEQKETLDLSSWKVAFNGSEHIRAETLQRFSEAFYECGFRPETFYPCYGMAETTLLVSGGIFNREPVLKHVQAEAMKQNQIIAFETPQKNSKILVGCGCTILEQDIIIVDPNAQVQCPPEQVGEIWVAGKNVAQGYWNRKSETQATFAAYLSDTHEGPYLRTGDLGFLDPKGELFITGRLKEVIIIRGRNYYPQDIEQVAQKSHPALRPNSGAAFSVDFEGQERLIIAHETKRSYLPRLNITEIVSAIRRAVSEEFDLQVYSVLLLKTNSIFKTSSGKLQRLKCRSAFLNGQLNVIGYNELKLSTDSQQDIDNPNHYTKEANRLAASASIICQWLVNRLAERLDLDPTHINVDKPIAEYGLDSLTAISLSGELQEWLGRPLPVTFLYDHPTIAALSQYLSKSAQNSSSWGNKQFLDNSEAAGYFYPQTPVMDGMSGSRIRRNGQELINLSGINLLGLQEDEKFIEIFCDKTRQYGLATGGSRLTQGVCLPHLLLEQKMNELLEKEYTLTFATGALANIGFINAMSSSFAFDEKAKINNDDVVFVLDRDCHWSLWNPVSRLKFGSQVFAFKHNDTESLEQVLKVINSNKIVVVFETIYSSDGSIAPIDQILDVCERYKALSYVDDANGFMIYGTPKRPFYKEYHTLTRATFIMVSFSKAIGIEGGAISGPIEFVKSFEILSGTSLFTATMQPPTAATNLEIIKYLQSNSEMIDNYLERCSQLRETLINSNFRLNTTPSYITSIFIGHDQVAEQVRRELLEEGYCVPVFRYPAVERGKAIIRLILNNRHTQSDINGFVKTLKKVRDRYKF